MAKYWFEKWSLKTDEVVEREVVNEIVDLNTERHFLLQTGTSGLKYTSNGNKRLPTVNYSFLYPWVDPESGAGVSDYRIFISFAEYEGSNQRRISGTVYRLEYAKNLLIENIIADESEYPANGIQGDYWYVKGEKAFPSLKIQGIGNISGAKLKDSTGQIRNVGNVYFKDSNGLVRNLK